jgi:hypothetical protein
MLVIVGPFAAGCFWKVIHATANGADEIVEWPQEPWGDHIGTLARVIYHGSLSLAISYSAGLAASHWLGPQALPITTCVGVLLLFPFFTISSMESQQITWPFSATVSMSLLRLWWGWLVMYLEIGVLMAIWGATVVFTFESSPYLTVLWSSPLLAAVALISARLFGRLLCAAYRALALSPRANGFMAGPWRRRSQRAGVRPAAGLRSGAAAVSCAFFARREPARAAGGGPAACRARLDAVAVECLGVVRAGRAVVLRPADFRLGVSWRGAADWLSPHVRWPRRVFVNAGVRRPDRSAAAAAADRAADPSRWSGGRTRPGT